MKYLRKIIQINPALLTSIVLIAGFYLFFFSDIILSPNSYMHSAQEDGLKNYYTFSYQIAHKGSSVNFDGMNYPYGEHVIYTDGQALISLLLGWIPFLKGYEVGLLNSFMYLSILIGAVLIWKIFRKLNVNDWVAAAGVFSIIILSPQFFRIVSHYALSYMWVIPLIILLLLNLIKSDLKIRDSVILGSSLFLIFLIHPYLGLMGFVFTFLTLFILFLLKKYNRKKVLISILITACSVIFFKLFITVTDSHSGRTDVPFGLFENNALLETVFVPYFSPFKPILAFFFPVLHEQPFEGWGYIGISVILVLIFSIGYFLISFFRKKSLNHKSDLSYFMPVFAASVFVLLFSMLIPIKWFPEEFIYKLGVLNQFRSLGRFSWVFYYTAGIFSFVLLNYFLIKFKNWKKLVLVSFIALFPVLNAIEAYPGFVFFAPQIGQTNNLFNTKYLDKESQTIIDLIKKDDASAILPLPFYHVGSEHVFKNGTSQIQQLSMTYSYHSGKPLISSFLSRTSIPESVSLFKLFAPEIENDELMDLNKFRNILILYDGEKLDGNEERLLKSATLVYKGEKTSLYRINFKKFTDEVRSNIQSSLKNLESSPLKINEFNLSDSCLFISDSFDEFPSEQMFAGKGAFKVEKPKFGFLKSLSSVGEKNMVASYWYYKGQSGMYNAMTFIEEIDTITNSGNWLDIKDARQSTVIYGDWVLIELPFLMKEGPFRYNVLIKGDDDAKGYYYLDNLIIREQGIDCMTSSENWTRDSKALFNNIPVTENKKKQSVPKR